MSRTFPQSRGVIRLPEHAVRMTFKSQAQIESEMEAELEAMEYARILTAQRKKAEAAREYAEACDTIRSSLPAIGAIIETRSPRAGIYVQDFEGFDSKPYVVASILPVIYPVLPVYTLNNFGKKGVKCFLDRTTCEVIESEFKNDLSLVIINKVKVVRYSASQKSVHVVWVR